MMQIDGRVMLERSRRARRTYHHDVQFVTWRTEFGFCHDIATRNPSRLLQRKIGQIDRGPHGWLGGLQFSLMPLQRSNARAPSAWLNHHFVTTTELTADKRSGYDG